MEGRRGGPPAASRHEIADLGAGGLLILQDLLAQGAAPREVLVRLIPDGSATTLELLIQEGLLVSVPTRLGTVYVLSAKAKRVLNVRSSWITRPEMATRQVLHRRLGEVLRRQGWHPEAPGALPYPRYRRPDGRAAYVLVSLHGPRSRAVRRVLEAHRASLLREGAVLTVYGRQWRRLRHLAQGSNGLLEVAPLDPALTAPAG